MTRWFTLRYSLFILLFLLVLTGVVVHSHAALVVCAMVAVAIGVFAERWEARSTEPYKHLNDHHHRKQSTSSQAINIIANKSGNNTRKMNQ
ncbi:MAG: hypothetical protein K6T83_17585 [Alicyclobacillus sp.]|nr:hypothetical protein [Alicyclobacillus sp.]